MNMEMVIDASNCILGRLASNVSKELVKGKSVRVINAEKAVISGDPKYAEKSLREKFSRGDPYHGPFYPREPDQIVKRTIRGMLPKNTKGRNALKKLRVYVSIPESLKDKKAVRVGSAENRLKCKYTELGKIAGLLGAKVRW